MKDHSRASASLLQHACCNVSTYIRRSKRIPRSITRSTLEMLSCLPRDSNPDKCQQGDCPPAAAAQQHGRTQQAASAERPYVAAAPGLRAARLPPGSAAPRLMTQPAAPRSPLTRTARPRYGRGLALRAGSGSEAAARPAPTWAAPPAAPGRCRGRLPPWRPLPGAPRGGGRAVAAAVTRLADAVLPGGGTAGPASSAPDARSPRRSVEAAAAREGRAWPRSVYEPGPARREPSERVRRRDSGARNETPPERAALLRGAVFSVSVVRRGSTARLGRAASPRQRLPQGQRCRRGGCRYLSALTVPQEG